MRMDMAFVMSAGAMEAPLEEVNGDSRSDRSVLARQVAMYLASAGFGLSYARVAQACGRDRSTVAHACRVVEEKREEPAFDNWVAALEMLAANMPVLR
jgi:chromosomal replication initiation ATPase DnaA